MVGARPWGGGNGELLFNRQKHFSYAKRIHSFKETFVANRWSVRYERLATAASVGNSVSYTKRSPAKVKKRKGIEYFWHPEATALPLVVSIPPTPALQPHMNSLLAAFHMHRTARMHSALASHAALSGTRVRPSPCTWVLHVRCRLVSRGVNTADLPSLLFVGACLFPASGHCTSCYDCSCKCM